MLTRIRELVSPLVTQYQLHDGIAAARIHRAWPLVVRDILGPTFPAPESLTLHDGVLWIAMPPAVVAQELQMRKRELLAGLTQAAGTTLVTDLRFRISGANHHPSDVGRRA